MIGRIAFGLLITIINLCIHGVVVWGVMSSDKDETPKGVQIAIVWAAVESVFYAVAMTYLLVLVGDI